MGHTFRPPIPNRLLCAIFFSIYKPFLAGRITYAADQEDLAAWRAIPPGSAYFIASKHAHFIDHLGVNAMAARVGTRCLFVSVPEVFSDYWGLAGMVVRRLGGFAVERGGTNIQATRYIVEAMVKGEYPFIIFPEGELYFLNDVVTPLKIGTALFALEGAKARETAGKPRSTYILPVGVKYVYSEDATAHLLKKLEFCEKNFYKQIRNGELFSRVLKLVDDVEEDSEKRFQIKCDAKSAEERFLSLSAELVSKVEKETQGKISPGEVSYRARRLMGQLKKGSVGYETARFALHCLDFLPGYLGEPTPERLMETLRKLERLLTGNENPSFPGKQIMMIRSENAIKVHDYLPAYLERRTQRETLHRLTADLQTSLQGSVDRLRRKAVSMRRSRIEAGISA